MSLCNEVVIIDFETTGLSRTHDRIIEVGAVLVRGNRVQKKFSQLMDPGYEIPPLITHITGITDDMLVGQPCPEEVMPDLADFIGERVLVAHNAGFDEGFIRAEMKRAGVIFKNPFLCTLKLSRRLLQELNSHKLGHIVSHLDIPMGKAHRALDDALATAHLWGHLRKMIIEKSGLKQPDLDLYNKISQTAARKVEITLSKIREPELF